MALLLLFGCMTMFSGCATNYPRIRITITFEDDNDDTEDDVYKLKYTLNRKLYPQTVTHFIELIEQGFYNGTVIHDYQSSNSRMIGGGYTYEDLETSDYEELVSLQDTYDSLSLSTSVWKQESSMDEDGVETVEYGDALNSLYGEVPANGFDIDGTGYTNSKGAIGTYTYISKSDSTQIVCAKKSSKGKDRTNLKYYNNAVTSMFYIMTSSSSSTYSNYCVFGKLANDDAEDRFDELMDAISDYIADQEELDEEFTFTETVDDITITDDMTTYGYYEAEFSVPAHARIVITSMKVLRY